jgi:thiosulfate/3-mercaptopyruvate sulfurtransferase
VTFGRREVLAELVDFLWIDQHREDTGLVIVDSRPPVKYLQGHIPQAVNLPTSKVFDRGSLEFLPVERLIGIVGDVGIDEDSTLVVCDDHDGQNEAMLAWTLELLGHPRVKLLSSFVTRWIADNRAVSYRPTKPESRSFRAKPIADVRANFEEISGVSVRLVDLRSRDEFEGKSAEGPQSKHLPGAVSLPWTNLLGEEGHLFRPKSQLETLLSETGLGRDDQIITYCSFGPRAAVGYAAFHQLGFKHLKLYDRSFQHWAKPTGLSLDNCLPSL